MKLSALDRRILYRIQRQPGLDDVEIADKLEVPAFKVSERLRKLAKAGLIGVWNRKAKP